MLNTQVAEIPAAQSEEFAIERVRRGDRDVRVDGGGPWPHHD